MCPIPRIPRQPGRRGFAGQFIHDITAAASVATGQTVRRLWRLSCCQGLDQSRYHTIPFDGPTGAGR
jgi:hypothetical protein